MISELTIEKYRGISNLRLENLGKVNIIAGENNTGKTSILEVIESLHGPNNLREWRVLGRRDGYNGSRAFTTVYDTMKSLFPAIGEGDKTEISYSGESDGTDFSIRLIGEFSETILSDEQIGTLGGYVYYETKNEYEHNEYEASVLNIKYIINGKEDGEDKLYNIQRGFQQSERKSTNIINNVVYVSPTQHANNTLYLNALMTDTEAYEQFVDIMREFDPDFISINSVEDEKTLSRKYVVLSKKFKEGLILNAYGDGMKKAMLLLSAVLKAKDGILLLDEFETAMHISVMGKVFKWIIENAGRLNVQIFMTSHSLEAISTVLKCCPEMKKDIRMITLVNTENGVKARNIDAVKAIQLKDEYGLELR